MFRVYIGKIKTRIDVEQEFKESYPINATLEPVVRLMYRNNKPIFWELRTKDGRIFVSHVIDKGVIEIVMGDYGLPTYT